LCNNEVETSEDYGARIGTDIVEIERFRTFTRNSPFIQKVFTEDEISYCFGFDDPAPHLAVTFAGKEAVVKALEMNDIVSITGTEIHRDASGVPRVRLLNALDDVQIRVSLSHSSTHAVAVAITYPRGLSMNSGDIQMKIDSAVLDLLQGE
jgi:holo-[acyl-carrier protein] synthase